MLGRISKTANRIGVVLLPAMLVASVILFDPGAASAAGDPAQGKKVFKKCKACHLLKPGRNKLGPLLLGVVGRNAGTLKNFKYSGAMRNAHIVWTADNLDKFLADPRRFIPGNRMTAAAVRREKDRANLIAFLGTFVTPVAQTVVTTTATTTAAAGDRAPRRLSITYPM